MLRKLVSIASIILVISFFYVNNTFLILDEFVSDQVIKEEKDVHNDIKLLVIDDKSLQEIGKWPWPRSTLAEVSEQLAEAGAKAVWLDILYTESSQDQADDQALQEVVAKHENVYLSSNFVLGSKVDHSGKLQIKNYHTPIVNIPSDQLGHINVIPDDDNVVRKVMLGIQTNNNEMVPAISVRLANLLLEEKEKQITWNPENNQWRLGDSIIPTGSKNDVRFTYYTEPHEDSQDFQVMSNKFDTQPIYPLINGDFPPEYYAESIVLIGPYTIGLQDQYTTPMSRKTNMYGVEIHANIIQSLIDEDYYSKASTPLGLSIIVIMSILSFFTIDRFKAKWGFAAFVGFVILYFLTTFAVFHTQQLLLPFFYIILLLTLVYITSVISQYVLERKEKARVTSLFGRYVSKGVVDEILSSTEEVKLGGVRKEVTLVFVDIRGFTPLSENMEPEEVIVILNEYLDLCTRAVFEFEGTLDKFMGDGVMAIFGAPIEQEDHAERSVRAALRMKEFSGEMERRLKERYGKTVSFGVGLNSGPAVIGNIGSHDRLDYTAIGDTVNLAARLESNAKPGQILISESTYELIKDQFETTALDAIKVKGKEKPVTIYQVDGEKH